MSQSTFVQQQRDLVHCFQHATKRRIQAETDAEAQRQTNRTTADARLKQKREMAAAQLAETQKAREKVEANLAHAGLPGLPRMSEPLVALQPSGTDVSSELHLSVSQVVERSNTLIAQVVRRLSHSVALDYSGSRKVRFVQFSPDCKLVALCHSDNSITLREVESKRNIREFKECAFQVRCIAIAPDGGLLVAGQEKGRIQAWKTMDGQECWSSTISLGAKTTHLVFSSDSKRIGSRTGAIPVGEEITLFTVDSGKQVMSFSQRDLSTALVLSPDDRLLASAADTRKITIWAVAPGLKLRRKIRSFQGHTHPISSMVFSSDSQLLAVGGEDGTVWLWDMETGREICTIGAHASRVTCLSFSPVTMLLASGGQDKIVRLWDVSSQREMRTITGHTDAVISLYFSPDGKTLTSACQDGTVQVWGLDRAAVEERTESFIQSMATAAFWQARWLEEIEQEHHHCYNEIEADYQKAMEEALSNYDQELARINQESSILIERVGLSGVPWLDPLWNEWTPARENAVTLTRLGQLKEAGKWHTLNLPALVPVVGNRSLLLETNTEGRSLGVQMLQSMLLRLLVAIPAGKLRFTFIDPIGLGQNVAAFMHLADSDETLVTGKAWTEPQHIEQRLADLTEHMENIIQKYLRNQFASIENYNAQAGEVAEPYRVLVVLDFPTGFSEVAARRLVSIAQNGPRCGVYAVMLIDTEKALPYNFSLTDLEQAATIIAWDGNRFVWQDPDFKDCLLEPDSPPDAEIFNRIVNAVGQVAKETSKVEVPFERIAPPQTSWWTGDSSPGLRVPLGPSGAQRLQTLDLGEGTAQHTLVVGKTGSGKSTLLHTLIINLALTYGPEEVQLYLVDFKKGVEFKPYATWQLPHARVVAIESEREFGLSVLQGLDMELKRRGDVFRKAGVDHLADYRQKNNIPLPRILLLVDEFQEFFTEDDSTAAQAAQILDRLVRQGRAFGIHVLLGSQTLAGAYTLARSTIDQMAVRIALQCTDADSRLILADDNPAARLLSRPGEAIYNAANGLVEGNNRFQVAWLPDDQRNHYLEQVVAMAQNEDYVPPQPQIVFEGGAPGQIEKNQLLHDLLSAPQQPTMPRALSAWVGEPVAIRDPVAAVFRRQSGNNLLIVGSSDEVALGITSSVLISLASQIPLVDRSSFYILDFGAVDASYADLLPRLVESLPHQSKFGRRRQLPDLLADLEAEVQRRIDLEDSPTVGSEQGNKHPIFLFLYGLQRARDLRQEEGFGFSSFREESPEPNLNQQFATILREGPDIGVHAVVWCDTVTNLNRSLDRRALREFALRVVLQMSAEDSSNLIDTPAASKLGLYRALFYSEEEGRLEKFRPYSLPTAAWLTSVGEKLKEKPARTND